MHIEFESSLNLTVVMQNSPMEAMLILRNEAGSHLPSLFKPRSIRSLGQGDVVMEELYSWTF